MPGKGRGWHDEPGRHALARKGVRTAFKRGTKAFPSQQREQVLDEVDAVMEINLEMLERGMTDWPFVHDAATEVKARAEMIMAVTMESQSPKANIVFNAANGIYMDAEMLQEALSHFGTDEDIAHHSNSMREKVRSIRRAVG